MKPEADTLSAMRSQLEASYACYEVKEYDTAANYAWNAIGLWKRHFRNSSSMHAQEAHDTYLEAAMMAYKSIVATPKTSKRMRMVHMYEQFIIARMMSHHADAGNPYLARVLRIRARRFFQKRANELDDQKHL